MNQTDASEIQYDTRLAGHPTGLLVPFFTRRGSLRVFFATRPLRPLGRRGLVALIRPTRRLLDRAGGIPDSD